MSTNKKRTSAKVRILSTIPASPAVLETGKRFYVKIAYRLDSTDTVRIWARPYTRGARTPGYKAHGSPLYKKEGLHIGMAVGYFFFDKLASVDEVRVHMWDVRKRKYICSISKKVNVRWAHRQTQAEAIRPRVMCLPPDVRPLVPCVSQ